MVYVNGTSDEYNRIQEINFYWGMLKQLNICATDDMSVKINEFLNLVKAAEIVELCEIEESVYSFASEMNLSLNKSLLT